MILLSPLLSLLLMLGTAASKPSADPTEIQAPVVQDTLDIAAFKAIFRYQGPGLFPDTLEKIDCASTLALTKEIWDGGGLPNWEEIRLKTDTEILQLPFNGIPYSLWERPGGGYFATFFYIDAEVSNHLDIKVLDENFHPVPEEMPMSSLAYCGGDAGYEWYRSGHFVNDSVYVYCSIAYDETYDSTWASVSWDKQGFTTHYPFDVSPYLGKKVPWLDLAAPYFPWQDTLVFIMDSVVVEAGPWQLDQAFSRALFLKACYEENLTSGIDTTANLRLSEDAFFHEVCKFRLVTPIAIQKTGTGGYFLTLLKNDNGAPSFWLMAFTSDGAYHNHCKVGQFQRWDRQTYANLQGTKLTVTQLQTGKWVEPDTLRRHYRLTPLGEMVLERKEEKIKGQ